jgi:hypothetical protein
VGLIEISGPTLVDCNDSFGQVFGFNTAKELVSQNRPVSDFMLPEGMAISRRFVTRAVQRVRERKRERQKGGGREGREKEKA